MICTLHEASCLHQLEIIAVCRGSALCGVCVWQWTLWRMSVTLHSVACECIAAHYDLCVWHGIVWRIPVELNKGKDKVFYGQEPPSGEPTTTECGVNYQLLAVIIGSSPLENRRNQRFVTLSGTIRHVCRIL